MADPKAYLKQLGMLFDVKPKQIDARFRKSLSEHQRGELEEAWEAMSMGITSGVALYEFPQTMRQAALLFSHDANRYRQSLRWFDKIVEKLAPSSTFEVGCGAAFTSGFLKYRYPHLSASGIEAHENLIHIAKEQLDGDTFHGDYLETSPMLRANLVFCDFGFDLADFIPSTKPHGEADHDGFKYCPGCRTDLVPQFESRLAAWKGWLMPGGHIAVVGRFTDFGAVSAAVEAGSHCGLSLHRGLSTVLRVRGHNGLERFPALVFSDRETSNDPLSVAAEVYRK